MSANGISWAGCSYGVSKTVAENLKAGDTYGKIPMPPADLNESAKDALDQIQKRQYAQKYTSSGKSIHQIGVGFDGKTRNIGAWVAL